ncbi:MAG: hypothetical protein R2717_09575 [Schumannella sp.]
MTPLPAVLGSADLPLAERMAARLDGELYALGSGHCPIDEPSSPALRLAAILTDRSPALIAELSTAAWVWTAIAPSARVLELCVPSGTRAHRAADPEIVVREVVHHPGDVTVLGRHRVTTPMRTVLDLARVRIRFERVDLIAVRGLAAVGGFDRDACVAALRSRRNLPGRTEAIRRLDEAFGISPR